MADADSFQQERRTARSRRLGMLTGIGAVVLGARLFDLQVLGVEEYTLLSERNRIRREWVSAPRGLIVDRNGEVLADSRPSFTVLAIPKQLLSHEERLGLLSELLEVPAEEIRERLASGQRHLPRVLRRDVGFAQVSRIAEREEELPGVSLQVTNVRAYPKGSLAAHVLGHVGEISEEEVRRLRGEGYRVGHFVGRTGIERVYERELRGRDGERYLEVDAVGRVVGRFAGRAPVPPETGRTLRLELDARLQAVAESLLAGDRGAVCVLDVRTGGTLVLASSPTFDPNSFATGIEPAEWARLNTDPERPLLDRAVQAVYAPGSTFKIIPFVLGLERGLLRWGEPAEVPCQGGYRFGNRWFGCWEEVGHGRLDFEMALVRSCDTYFYQLGERLGADDLAEAAQAAGLGRPTGIDLPQELSGNVPTSAWLDARYGEGRWTQGNVLNLVIGQGEYLVTPLQMARCVAAVANGGRLLVPRIVRAVEGGDGTLCEIPARVEGTWRMSARTARRLREAMRLVVDHEEGTGRVCRIEGFPVAGKTGTAENPHGPPHSWFVGFAPFEDPKIAFSVIVEAGGHGSDRAAPIAREILRAYRAGNEGIT